MTVKELEEFRVICEKGSLAKASKELFMSPQGLSRVLKNLENELDCVHFQHRADNQNAKEEQKSQSQLPRAPVFHEAIDNVKQYRQKKDIQYIHQRYVTEKTPYMIFPEIGERRKKLIEKFCH